VEQRGCVTNVQSVPQPQITLIRALGRWSLVALTLNSMVGRAVFGLPAVIAGLLGKFSTLAVVIAGAVMGVIMACFAGVASRFSESGGPYLYGRTAFGRLVGILVGWTLYLAQAAAPAANANLFVVYLAEFWPGVLLPLPRFRCATGNPRWSTSSRFAKFLPLLLVIVAGMLVMIVRPAASSPSIAATSDSWLKALVLLVFAYGDSRADSCR